jgi:hypothetical protein
MVQMSNKWFIALFFIAILAAVLIVVGLFLGWFKPLEGFGGQFTAGLFEVLAFLPRFVVAGWPQMIFGVCLLVAALFAAGYLFEQKQIIATIKGSANPSTGVEAGYTNTMNREPPEPEQAPKQTG